MPADGCASASAASVAAPLFHLQQGRPAVGSIMPDPHHRRSRRPWPPPPPDPPSSSRTAAGSIVPGHRRHRIGRPRATSRHRRMKSELPGTFKAYRYQQHRWSCGPANLFRKMVWDIIQAKRVLVWTKFYVICNFFLARRIISHMVTFFFYCIVIPVSVFFPEVEIPKWAVVYMLSFHLIIFWVLFENVMSLHRCKAVFIGLFEAGRLNEWVITEKLGDMLNTKPNIAIPKKFQFTAWKSRFNTSEIIVGLYLLICCCYGYAFFWHN